MDIKLFEIRDEATFVPALAIKLSSRSEEERFLLSRAGFGRTNYEQSDYILLNPLTRNIIEYDPVQWDDRTFFTAHDYIMDHWYELESGAVVDVSFILGERAEPRKSERIYDA